MENIVNEIKNYILFLKKDCGLEITLHPFENEHLISSSELISFNIHENPHCIYIKTFPDAHRHCICRQDRIMDKCKTGSFCGTCFAGVMEYVYPINTGTLTVGFICVSGYRTPNYTSYIDKCSERFVMPRQNLHKTILSLKPEMPDKSYVDTLLIPLVRMLELAYNKLPDIKDDTGITKKIIRYMNRHYAENITLEQICKTFSLSRSCVSHKFKKETGKTFREYLIDIRIRSAKSLLLSSKLSIFEIALSVGFNDSNYFSYTFKSHTKMSPSAYRKQSKSLVN